MANLIPSIVIEFRKNRNSKITWITFISFALAPIMGGVFVMIVRDAEIMAKLGALQAKAIALNFTGDWNSYFSLLSQAVGVGGVLLFGFVSSWIFGREFSEGTSKDLLALPVSRSAIIDAKFIAYFLWCFALAVSNMLVALLIGATLGLPGWDVVDIGATVGVYLLTTLLTILVGIPVAFFAMSSGGYMSPLAFVVLTLVFAQVIAATGFGAYFPWAIPGLYSGAGGGFRSQLNWWSYGSVAVVSVVGYVAARRWFNVADQAR